LLLISVAFARDIFAGRVITTQENATSGEGDANVAAK
jgi:hypothetical protein